MRVSVPSQRDWEALGVASSVSLDELKRARVRRMRDTHPDRPGGSTEAAQRTNEAYNKCRAFIEGGRLGGWVEDEWEPPTPDFQEAYEAEQQRRKRQRQRWKPTPPTPPPPTFDGEWLRPGQHKVRNTGKRPRSAGGLIYQFEILESDTMEAGSVGLWIDFSGLSVFLKEGEIYAACTAPPEPGRVVPRTRFIEWEEFRRFETEWVEVEKLFRKKAKATG